MLCRAMVVLDPAFLTWSKLPATTTFEPTTAMARTVPAVTWGGVLTGFCDTTALWLISAWAAGIAAPAVTADVATATLSTRRRMVLLPGGGARGPSGASAG